MPFITSGSWGAGRSGYKPFSERYPDLFPTTNPYQEGTKDWEKWNRSHPDEAKKAEAAKTVTPLSGAAPSFYTADFGGIPATADPTRSAANAVTGNVANLPAIEDMAGGINRFNIGEQQAQYNTALPGYGGMVGQSAANIGSRLRGEIPSDVVRQITDQAAGRGVSLGMPGSPFSNSELVRSLGLTSLGLTTQAEGELTQAIGRTPTVPLFNTSSFLVSPQMQQDAQQQANVMAAAPVPAKAQQTALDIARAGINAGASSIPAQSSYLPQQQQSNSYSLVSDILSRYQQGSSGSADPYAIDRSGPDPNLPSYVNAPPPTYANIPDFLEPPESNLNFNWDDLGLWPN